MSEFLKGLYSEKTEVEAKRNERYFELAMLKKENRKEPCYKVFLERDIERLEAKIRAIDEMIDDLENALHEQDEEEVAGYKMLEKALKLNIKFMKSGEYKYWNQVNEVLEIAEENGCFEEIWEALKIQTEEH